MKSILGWLGKNKTITVLLAIVVYFCIVTFHDEVTQVAINLRNAIGMEKYNAWLAIGFALIFVLFLAFLARSIYRSSRRILSILLTAGISILIIISFRLLMTYNIEAIHFVEYMLVAIILYPALRSFGETVFWTTMLGILDEIFQYLFLTPQFEYFDFNDCVLNMLGAGAGMVLIFISAPGLFGRVDLRPWKSPAMFTGILLLIFFIIFIVTGKITVDPTGTAEAGNWFSLNRKTMPDEFWREAYKGRRLHIMGPAEGIIVFYLTFAAFFLLDYLNAQGSGVSKR